MARVLIIGAGFAGMWAALGAARARQDLGAPASGVRIDVIAPTPMLCLKPRLYERDAAVLDVDIGPLLAAVDVGFIPATVEALDLPARTAVGRTATGAACREPWDALVLAAGSHTLKPPPAWVPHLHVLDSAADARRLRRHLSGLPARRPTAGRYTGVVVGAGFTGLEIATELAGWLRDLAGPAGETARVVLLDRAATPGASLGEGPQAAIAAALAHTAVDFRPASLVRCVGPGRDDGDAVAVLEGGSRIDAATVVWAAGLRASPLAAALGGADAEGRLAVDGALRVAGQDRVFAAGDVARAETAPGRDTLMSCQHAMPTGRIAGHNAVRALAGVEAVAYAQPMYVTCLDLGEAGGLLSHGWNRAVVWTGAEAKSVKRMINGRIIAPPPADQPALALQLADPAPMPALDPGALAARWRAMLDAAAGRG